MARGGWASYRGLAGRKRWEEERPGSTWSWNRAENQAEPAAATVQNTNLKENDPKNIEGSLPSDFQSYNVNNLNYGIRARPGDHVQRGSTPSVQAQLEFDKLRNQGGIFDKDGNIDFTPIPETNMNQFYRSKMSPGSRGQLTSIPEYRVSDRDQSRGDKQIALENRRRADSYGEQWQRFGQGLSEGASRVGDNIAAHAQALAHAPGHLLDKIADTVSPLPTKADLQHSWEIGMKDGINTDNQTKAGNTQEPTGGGKNQTQPEAKKMTATQKGIAAAQVLVDFLEKRDKEEYVPTQPGGANATVAYEPRQGWWG